MSRRSDRSLLFVIGSLDVGGAETHLVRVLPGLAASGLKPAVFTISRKGRLAPRLEARGIPVIEPPFAAATGRLPRPIRRVVGLATGSLALLLAFFRLRPRVTHFFLPRAYVLGGLLSLVAPAGARAMSRRSLNDYRRRHPVAARVERWLHPRMDAILANSRAVLAQLREEGAPGNRLGLIYNGVDRRAFRSTEPRRALRARLGLDETALVMAKVANLIAYKGHADLLRALADVGGELPVGWSMLLAGAGPEEAALRRLASDLGLDAHVRFLGSRDDVADILAAADIGVLCSHEEGFSNGVLEKMAAGLPLVVTGVGGNPEAVVDGETGLVVPARDRAALGAAILALAADGAGRRAMGEAGRRRVERRFSLDACVARHRALYEGLMEGRTGAVADSIATADREED